LIWQKT